MDVCNYKPNENFQRKMEGIFISKPRGLSHKYSHKDELSYTLEALFQNQGRKSIFVKT
jgi:hypothetical protein